MLSLSTVELIINYAELLKICCMYATFYPLVYFVLDTNINFYNLKFSKKLYVVKNVIKSLSLAYLTFKTIFYVHDILYLGNLDMNLIRWWGTLFVANDLTALIMVPDLPSNTRNHHIMTFLLLNIVYIFDGNKFEIIKLISIYTLFSYYAFLVNLYLGLRFLVTKGKSNKKTDEIVNKTIDNLRVLAFYNYGLCLFLNWSFHIYYIYSMFSYLNITHLLYSIFLVPIIKDDLILLSWLKYKNYK